MSQQLTPQPAEPHEQATNKGVSVELSQEIVTAIADYIDVLIEIDLCQKQLKQGEENGNQGRDK